MSTRPDPPFAPGSHAAWSQADDPPGHAHDPTRDRYQPGGELGRGGMGVVALASDVWLGRDVAIKRPHADLPDALRARMAREARLTSRLVHPAIPPVYDVGEDAQGPWYSMPVLAGRTLAEVLQSPGLELHALIAALASVCQAIGHAHARGIVHRDLKPANILLGDHGEVWVMDWGVAFDPTEPDQAVVGTEGYRAPEQAAGHLVTPAADVYSLGATLDAILRACHPSAPELATISARCLHPEPARRYADGDEVALELHRWLQGQRVLAHAYTVRHLLWLRLRPHRGVLAVTTVAAMTLIGMATVSWRAQQAERHRADLILAASLAQQAVVHLQAGDRAEAEVLAAHALTLADVPLARGVSMAWEGLARPTLLRSRPLPCPAPFLQADGQVVCVGDRVEVYDAQGVLSWSAAYADQDALGPDPADGSWRGAVLEARAIDGGLLLHHSGHLLEVWSGGRRVSLDRPVTETLGLATGDVPGVFGGGLVGRVDLTSGQVQWEQTHCPIILAADLTADQTLAACRDGLVSVSEGGQPPVALPIPGSPSLIAWASGPVVGTFEGDLWTRDGDGWTRSASGIGAPRQLLPLPGDRLFVVGERGAARVWSAPDHAILAALPLGVKQLALAGGDVLALGQDLRHYRLPASLPPADLDRTQAGGLSTLDLSPSGSRLLGGSATGEVVVWDAATGRADVLRGTAARTAKGGVFSSDDVVVFDRDAGGAVRMDLRDRRTWHLTGAAVRWSQRDADRVTLATYGGDMLWLDAHEAPHRVPHDVPILGVATGDRRWVLDADGAVHHETDHQTLTPVFHVGADARFMARSGPWLVFAGRSGLHARTTTGEVVWTWASPGSIAAMDANDAWIVAGDTEGRVFVLDPQGRPLAHVPGHRRRVSAVIVRDDVAWTGSWDGHVRRWGLQAVRNSPEQLVSRAQEAWGLALGDVVGGQAAP